VPLDPPASPTRDLPPPREEIELPLRGKALRDRIIVRIIAIDRAIHFVVLSGLAVAVFLFAAHQVRVRDLFYRLVNAAGSTGALLAPPATGSASTEHVRRRRHAVAAAASAYALLEGTEVTGIRSAGRST
jgi:hypothetical protein